MSKIEKGRHETCNDEANKPGNMTRHLDDFVSIAWMVPWKDQAQTTAGLKREFSLATINGASLWCFDMWGGVFKTPETMEIVAKAKKIWDQYSRKSLKTMAEVALIADPQSTRYLNDLNSRVSQVYHATRNKLNRMGAPFEVFSFNDLPKADLGQYKFFIFPGIFEMTPEKEELLKKYVFSNERTVLFIYAPGISDGKKLDASFVKALTGCDFKTPGVTKVKKEGWSSVYVPGYETVTPELLKELAAEAGVNIYCEDQVPVYANEKLAAVHVASGGEKIITLPGKAKNVTELYTGQVVKVRNRKFSYNFATPDTALFEIE